MRTTVAVLPFVLVAVLVTPATARRRVTLACYDGQAGVVAHPSPPFVSPLSRDAQVVPYPSCDSGADADGVCIFSFPSFARCRGGVGSPCGGEVRHVRVGHRKRYRAGVLLVCRPQQACASDADCIQPATSGALVVVCNHCVAERCQRDSACVASVSPVP